LTAHEGGVIRIGLPAEPFSLLPTNSPEIEGSTIVRLVYTGLIDLDPATGEVVYRIAESIESTDNRSWTIKLKQGYRFHNGEPVDADAFIRAWNFAADPANGQKYRTNFERIVGWRAMQGANPPSGGMTGLVKLDDYTFEVHLGAPFVSFVVFLHATSFCPMAKASLDDLESANSHPIGNGPMVVDDEGWLRGERIRLHAWQDYAGDRMLVDRLDFLIYADLASVYADLRAGRLDLARQVPTEAIGEARRLYGDRFVEVPTGTHNYLGFPLYHPCFANPDVRRAFSLAVDRRHLIDTVLTGAATPAGGLIPPMVQGGREEACPYSDFDPGRARALLASAGGWPAGEQLVLRFNPEGDHAAWVRAVGEQLREHLGIDFVLNSELPWADYLRFLREHRHTGPFRLGQLVGYNSPEAALKNYFYSDASSNYTGHGDPAFDSLLDEGERQADLSRAIPYYQRAEDILLNETLPVLPLWRTFSSVAYNENVSGVEYNVYDSNPVFAKLRVAVGHAT
jgi:oligopeptide transport system substrate-binding protein